MKFKWVKDEVNGKEFEVVLHQYMRRPRSNGIHINPFEEINRKGFTHWKELLTGTTLTWEGNKRQWHYHGRGFYRWNLKIPGVVLPEFKDHHVSELTRPKVKPPTAWANKIVEETLLIREYEDV